MKKVSAKAIAVTITPLMILIGLSAAYIKSFPFSYDDFDLNR
ncbi:Uncharacterised protein [BD1-7 clade bacterium]|nr:Uncharacterised protein [BD1-7 clade bacterium]